ncbi:MAG: hypothetical protein JOY78_12395, partial [Pseudonocardia sp.]|nr:hypothetical protein [Pseudonocardia sp.]
MRRKGPVAAPGPTAESARRTGLVSATERARPLAGASAAWTGPVSAAERVLAGVCPARVDGSVRWIGPVSSDERASRAAAPTGDGSGDGRENAFGAVTASP